MSVVTSITFITSSPEDVHRFQEIIATEYTRFGFGYQVTPVTAQGTKEPVSEVFQLGLNYADQDLINALRSAKWEDHTVLYLMQDGLYGAEIYVCGSLIHHYSRS